MGSWDRNFNEHPLWAKLDTLKERAEDVEIEDLEADEFDSLQYLLAAADNALARRKSTLPLLVPKPLLDSTSSVTDRVLTTFDNWQAGSADWEDMDSVTAEFLQVFVAWPAIATEAAAELAVTTTERVNAASLAAIKDVENERDALVEKIDTLQATAEKLTTAVGQQQTAISAALTTFATDSEKKLTLASQEWEQARAEHSDSASQTLTTLHNLESEARELVHAATSSVVATDYGRYARNKTIAAWTCDIAAAVIGSAGIAAILLHLYREGVAVDGNVGLSLTRLAASLGTLGIAALVAHRGHDHHAEARDAKRTDLALRQVGPFVANLAPEDRERVVVELTDRIFVKGELGESSADAGTSLWDRIQAARERAKQDAADA